MSIPTYIASPYGFAEGTRYWYREVFLPLVSTYVEVLDPWSVPLDHILSAAPEDRAELWIAHGQRHYDTIAEKAKLLIALLDQEPPDNGTVCEVAWAAAHQVPVIAYRNDLRAAGEEGLPYNLMISAAVRRSGGATVLSLIELEAELRRRV
jgi:nucleoside 2-deoxyribosyltransferase